MLSIYSRSEINNFVNPREGEVKLGKTVATIKNKKHAFDEIKNASSQFVLFGIPEDIGIQVNKGKGGAFTAFYPALTAFLNIQENQFMRGSIFFLRI